MIMTAVFHFAQLGGMIIWCFIFYFIFFICSVKSPTVIHGLVEDCNS